MILSRAQLPVEKSVSVCPIRAEDMISLILEVATWKN